MLDRSWHHINSRNSNLFTTIIVTALTAHELIVHSDSNVPYFIKLFSLQKFLLKSDQSMSRMPLHLEADPRFKLNRFIVKILSIVSIIFLKLWVPIYFLFTHKSMFRVEFYEFNLTHINNSKYAYDCMQLFLT